MVHLVSRISRFFVQNHAVAQADNVARQLLEGAQARAGSHPYQAQEMRDAASAYLRVIR
jgi:hypothetical protein